ncbi:MAG: tol-pal system protein YbgF [Candidatus Methylomirabilales bacterium]
MTGQQSSMRGVRFRWVLLALGGVFVVGGCAVPGQQQVVGGDIQKLQREVASLSRATESNRVFMEERLQKLEQAVGEGVVPQAGEGQADLAARFQEVTAELRLLQGQVEESTYRLSEIAERIDDLETRVASLSVRPEETPPGSTPRAGAPSVPRGTAEAEPPTAVGGQPGVPVIGSPRPPGQPLPPGSGSGASAPRVRPTPEAPQARGPERPAGLPPGRIPSPDEVYRTALSDYTKGNYDLAISGFKTYLTFFPKTNLVPFAQYWLGETYYSKRDYVSAIREFDRLIEKHADSSKVPSAMLKKGYAYLEMGETHQARTVLRQLTTKFPNSSEARLAESTLSSIP